MPRIRAILILLVLSLPTVTLASSKSPLSYKGYIFAQGLSNFHGGVQTKSLFTGAMRVTATYDTAKAGWWQGGQIALGVLGIGMSINHPTFIGATQTPNGYSGYSNIRFNDLAYQHAFNKKFLIRAGIMDMDDYINDFEVANNLLNSAFANTQTINWDVLIATYPYPGFGALGQLGDQQLGIIGGVFQGNPYKQDTVFDQGQFVVAEFYGRKAGNKKYNLQYTGKLGLWDNQQSDPFIAYTDHGMYIIAEATWLYAGRNFGFGINLGFNPKINTPVNFVSVTDSVAIAFTMNGLFKTRPKDSLNLGYAHAWLAGVPQPQNETTYELNYTLQLTNTVTLAGDLQYFTHPGGFNPNAWVGLVRLQYTFLGSYGKIDVH